MSENVKDQASTGSVTVTESERRQKSPALVLKLRNPKNDKKVVWSEGTVDNEFMDKKKSKCCCIYKKPSVFGESSSDESGDDCSADCTGHKKKTHKKHLPGCEEHPHEGNTSAPS